MTKPQLKTQPTWTDVKAKLAVFDRPALLDLLHHLYAAHKDNQAFLHARFGLGEDVLEPYKKTIDRWVWPDPFRNQDTSASKAKQAISDYKKAVGDPDLQDRRFASERSGPSSESCAPHHPQLSSAASPHRPGPTIGTAYLG